MSHAIDLIPPIVIVSREEVMLFADVAAAEAYLEPIDVKNGEYVAAYESRGLQLQLTTTVHPRKLLGLISAEVEHVSLKPNAPLPSPSALEQALRKFLVQTGKDPQALAVASLPALLQLARESGAETR